MSLQAVELPAQEETPRRPLTFGAVVWSNDQIEFLKKLWDDQSLSCRVIAGEINSQFGTSYSRNSVISKIHRLGLPMRIARRHPVTGDRLLNNERKRQAVTYRRRQSKPRLFLVVPPEIVDLEIPVGQRKTFQQLDNCHCRWPVGEPDKLGFFFCGAAEADVKNGRPYCPSHQFRSRSHAA